MKLDERRLHDALFDALKDVESYRGFTSFTYNLLSQGTYATTLRMTLSYPDRPRNKVIVKWYPSEPSTRLDEPTHALFNQIDNLLNAEVRNRYALETIEANKIIPFVIGKSSNYRLLVIEPVGRKTAKKNFLDLINITGYDGTNSSLPAGFIQILDNAFELLAPLLGMCSSHFDHLVDSHPHYQSDAELKQRQWANNSYERIRRLVFRVHGEKGTGKLNSLGSVEKFMEDKKVEETLSDLLQIRNSFQQPTGFHHGDFNLSQIIGTYLMDFELFGIYDETRDFSSCLIVAGLKDSAGILLSREYQHLVDHYLASIHLASSYDDYDSAKRSLRRSHLEPDFLHELALRRFSGDLGKYSQFTANTWNGAIDELLKLGAAYDRRQFLQGSHSVDYGSICEGALKGLSSIFSLPEVEPQILDKCPDREVRNDYFGLFKRSLKALELPGF